MGPFLYDGPLSAAPFNISPQLVNPIGNLTDATNWTLLQWSYTATGGERFMLIGNFQGDGSTTVVNQNCGAINPYAYYYVDEVSVIPGVCALPVDFGSIHAEQKQDHVQVSWETSRESGIAYFEVERSKDGQNFLALSRRSPNNRQDHNWYSFEDFETGNAMAYYRIASVDLDGAKTLSEVVAVQNAPAPGMQIRRLADASLEIRVRGDACQSASLQVLDANGRMVLNFPAGKNTLIVPTGRLSSGLYFLKKGTCLKKVWVQ